MNQRNLAAAIILALMFVTTVALAENLTSRSKVSGIDKSLFSDSVSAGENFYLYANQQWLEATEIPGDKSNYGIFTLLDDMTREQVRELIEQAASTESKTGSAAQKVGDLYESALSVETRNDAGVRPLGDLLRLINGTRSKRDIAATLGSLAQAGVYGPLAAYVNVDAKDSDRYAVYVTQSGLTLPDRDYYIEDEARYVKLRDEVKIYFADMLAFLSVPNAASAGRRDFRD